MVYFSDTDESFYEKMKLINALEILITPDDKDANAKKLEFTWDITAYS